MQELVILVNEQDERIGVEEKMKAHLEGKLHRAFSVFVFNSAGELLLQQRASHKYHSPDLWSNTCCSHPRWKPEEEMEETIEAAAHRRLEEEMGFDCHFEKVFDFIYKAELDNDLIEHEFDHVLMGKFDGFPKRDPEEVRDWKWISPDELLKHIKEEPNQYTYWFKHSLENEEVRNKWRKLSPCPFNF